ncbi:hypothetical protein [Paracoccus aminophilus]|uniref:hypothetical protein n=1 Tax=Paracoccus aminophilus TaxID=34003 RepID=UPI00130DF6DD|nr:hypothetical protein [Paracoccus aminophilus]
MTATCKHQNGDFVNGYWLCGQCFRKLPERPGEIYWKPSVEAKGYPSQQIVTP